MTSHQVPALIALSLLGLAQCSSRGPAGPVYSGTVEAVEVDVVPEVAGRILALGVDQGHVVEAGSLIATIDPASYRITLAEAEAAADGARAKLALVSAGYRTEEIDAAARQSDEAAAQLAQATARVARVEDLVSQRVATQDDLDIARRDRDVAEARLAAARQRHALLARGFRRQEIEQARADLARLEAQRDRARLDLERTEVRSPLKGTVTQKLQEPGEYARPGSPIVSVADLDNLFTWVYLSEVELPRVRVGDEVSVRIDAFPGRAFPGRVVYISPEAEFTPKNVQTVEDRVQQVYGVKVAVANPDGTLKVGIPADVALTGPERR
ncbi:MAG TPA: HlyD family efflux transporter periplasmic adaptor subunit [Candidatus Polarisedimenticolia bacterium]|nr:HlyD family efflux transporter periplasmic adaptor subunit [Candidatus Polarisedimenticolia bacterium]